MNRSRSTHVGSDGVVGHHPGPQHMCQRGQSHGRALMAGAGGVGCIHRQPANDVDGAAFQIGFHDWLTGSWSAVSRPYRPPPGCVALCPVGARGARVQRGFAVAPLGLDAPTVLLRSGPAGRGPRSAVGDRDARHRRPRGRAAPARQTNPSPAASVEAQSSAGSKSSTDAVKPCMALRVPMGPISPAQNMPAVASPAERCTISAS